MCGLLKLLKLLENSYGVRQGEVLLYYTNFQVTSISPVEKYVKENYSFYRYTHLISTVFMYYGPPICLQSSHIIQHVSLSYPYALQLSHDVPAGAGFLCYNVAMFRDTIMGTFCTKTMVYVRQINVRRHAILLEVPSKKVPDFFKHCNT
jgi:hypothetical protein